MCVQARTLLTPINHLQRELGREGMRAQRMRALNGRKPTLLCVCRSLYETSKASCRTAAVSHPPAHTYARTRCVRAHLTRPMQTYPDRHLLCPTLSPSGSQTKSQSVLSSVKWFAIFLFSFTSKELQCGSQILF